MPYLLLPFLYLCYFWVLTESLGKNLQSIVTLYPKHFSNGYQDNNFQGNIDKKL